MLTQRRVADVESRRPSYACAVVDVAGRACNCTAAWATPRRAASVCSSSAPRSTAPWPAPRPLTAGAWPSVTARA